MTVKELKSILSDLPEDLEIRMLTNHCDNLNEGYEIKDVVFVTPIRGDQYAKELILIPE